MEQGEAVITVDPISGAHRVLLVDDHAIVREVLRSILEGYRELAIIGEAADGRQAVSMAAALKPDVIVMDVNMPWMNGHEATKRIKRGAARDHCHWDLDQ
jgi:DNA-binding NarL/FixJ family response regulator